MQPPLPPGDRTALCRATAGLPRKPAGNLPLPLASLARGKKKKQTMCPPLFEGVLMCSSRTGKLTSPQVTRPDQKVGSTHNLGHLGAPPGGQCLHSPTLPRVPPPRSSSKHLLPSGWTKPCQGRSLKPCPMSPLLPALPRALLRPLCSWCPAGGSGQWHPLPRLSLSSAPSSLASDCTSCDASGPAQGRGELPLHLLGSIAVV